ncbi:hypothetical protein NJ76_31495 [Rhodococcus sp. IITR03]|nr:hypothetical protein NJ76_31495 [Rhodococcus sp. IITR03]
MRGVVDEPHRRPTVRVELGDAERREIQVQAVQQRWTDSSAICRNVLMGVTCETTSTVVPA